MPLLFIFIILQAYKIRKIKDSSVNYTYSKISIAILSISITSFIIAIINNSLIAYQINEFNKNEKFSRDYYFNNKENYPIESLIN